MFEPQVPLIALSPAVRSARLAEIELGRLLVLRATNSAAAGLGVRADALSARAELSAGVLRLSGGPVRFEALALETMLAALEIEYLLEADLPGLAMRAPASGDLIVTSGRPAAGLFVSRPGDEGAAALFDPATATLRPYLTPRVATQLALGWRLVERAQRTRVLLEYRAPEPYARELPHRAYGEDGD